MEFNKLDVNRDNVLTKVEWNGDANVFRKLDINSDGYVSAAEYVAAAPLTGAIGGYGSGSTENRFMVKDRNRDGLLTRCEYGVDGAPFDRVDRNDDGRVSYDEFLNQPAADSRQARFDELDRNNDGVVSRSEWGREAGVFHLADRNGDGVVTLREYLNAPAGRDLRAAVRADRPRQRRRDRAAGMAGGRVGGLRPRRPQQRRGGDALGVRQQRGRGGRRRR